MVTTSKAAARRPARRSDASDNIFELAASSVSSRASLAREAILSRWKQQVVHHDWIVQRADSIVKIMLPHWRFGPSEHRASDLNTNVEVVLNLAYHGARAETPGFNITLKKELDPQSGEVDLDPQEFTRAMLNQISNGSYATRSRAEQPPVSRPGAFTEFIVFEPRKIGNSAGVRT